MLKEFTEIQKTEQAIRGPQFNRDHGSLFDRGSADSYYGRIPNPHWYPEGTGHGQEICRAGRGCCHHHTRGVRKIRAVGN